MFVNLQPLNVCMSFKHTHRILHKISEDYDANVKVWAEKLSQLIEKPPEWVGGVGGNIITT